MFFILSPGNGIQILQQEAQDPTDGWKRNSSYHGLA